MAAAHESVFIYQPFPILLSPGKRAKQARDGPTAHPEPVRKLAERQQERQRHTAGSLCGGVSGELLAAPAEGNQHTQ